ncbi:unnamed protein product [Ilex paraguariensis]|uniref:C2 domain-containing protein n=1 Tax=Ilex paraguariensis TaxID=185542 RepID=A0ABC8TC76_9AQUA
MVTLRTHHAHLLQLGCHSPRFLHFRNPNSISFSKKPHFPGKIGFLSSGFGNTSRGNSFNCCFLSNGNTEVETVTAKDERERPSFDINLAVILAGFAFEAYTTPPENLGKREVDAANCKTVFLSESFVREIYDGQLFIKLKKGFNFPAMDPWGTSDPYVVMQLDSQVFKSKVKWGTREPTWNEEFTLNVKQPPSKDLQVVFF